NPAPPAGRRALHVGGRSGPIAVGEGARVVPATLRSERAAQPGLLERRRFAASGPAPQWRRATIFRRAPTNDCSQSPRDDARFASRSKIAARRHPPLRSGRLRGAGPARPPPLVAMKAAMGAADPIK